MNVFRPLSALRAAALAGLAFLSCQAGAAIEVVSPEVWTLYRGSSIVQPRVAYPSKAACEAAAALDVRHKCQGVETFVRRADPPPPTCTTPQPATQTRTQTCPSGTTGSWSQTLAYSAAPYPTCWTAGAWTPASAPSGACTAVPTTPPPTVPTGSLLAGLLNFAETASRNWSYGGHNVVLGAGSPPFNENYGYWDYAPTTYEPWLFNRPEAFKRLCDVSGIQKWCDQANSDLAYYQSRISTAGYFMNKTGEQDTKYGYIHPWSQRADNAAIAKRIYDASVAGWPNTANLGDASLWTERELWVALKAAIRYHDISGDAAALVRAKSQVDQWDQVSAGRGAPLVSYTKHEGGGPGGTTPTDLVSSPWMSALYFQAAREYIGKVPAAAPQVYKQASDYFDWLNAAGTRGFYPGSDAHPEYTGLTFPAYLAGGTTIGDAGPDEGNMAHALDVAGFVCFAAKAKQALGLPTALANQRLAEMKATALRDFELQTRTANWLPKYRVNPPRKFNWMAHGYHELKVGGCE